MIQYTTLISHFLETNRAIYSIYCFSFSRFRGASAFSTTLYLSCDYLSLFQTSYICYSLSVRHLFMSRASSSNLYIYLSFFFFSFFRVSITSFRIAFSCENFSVSLWRFFCYPYKILHLILSCSISSSLTSYFSYYYQILRLSFQRSSLLLLQVQISVIRLWLTAYDYIFCRQRVHLLSFRVSPFLMMPCGGCQKRQSLQRLCPHGNRIMGL